MTSINAPILFTRREIPFFYDKSPAEFKQDPYERYDDMVSKQSALHLADALWGHYPIQPVMDFAQHLYPSYEQANILEIGCGVGRWIGSLAHQYPKAQCWGIDYSYQMLKRAHEYWLLGKTLELNLANRGFSTPIFVPGHQLENLQLGLAKATALPFSDQSQDLVLSSFLLDRIEDPQAGLDEMYRVLKQQGRLILVTPLNFHHEQQWVDYYPPPKLRARVQQMGFELELWQENLHIFEPLDAHGNAVIWKCVALIALKK
ncbi:MAG: class I SAM-dependent methyltransferase [Bacteroidota bacterium]